jgi:succinate dehydrogenase subunit C
MSATPAYTEFHPRWHRTRVSTYWWLGRASYLLFILRELSSVFIAWFVVFTLWQISAVGRGREAYERFQAACRHPAVLALNVVSLFFVVLHAVTWFQLAPKAMVVHFRGQRVPPAWIMGANFGLWALVSAVIAWVVIAGS